MDYKKVGEQILNHIGGTNNIESATHCATRLRLVLKDEEKVDKKALERMNEVKGIFSSGGQFQIIIGQGTVNKVYAAMVEDTGIRQASTADVKREAMKNMNPFQRFARMLSNIFVPIIPAIVASGLLMGLLGMSTTFGWLEGDNGIFILLDMFSNAAFVFLPILIAFSAAKEFGANPFLAAVLGGILIHPNLQNAWTLGEGVQNTIQVLGFNVSMVGYQGTVLPILIAVWVMGYIERSLRKVVPDVLDIIVTPFLTLMISAFISLLIIGPAGRIIGDGISVVLSLLYNTTGAVSGLVFGGLYSTIVITGIHHSFHAVETGLLTNPDIGRNFLLPIWSMANVAQGGAALAVYFKTNNDKLKSIAAPASLSSLLGITEAAIFGVNLRLVRPFIAAAIGGAIGGGYIVLMNVAMTAVGVTGIPGIAIVEQGYMLNYLIGLIIAFTGAFFATYIIGFKEENREEEEIAAKATVLADDVDVEPCDITEGDIVIVSPISGKVLPITKVPDRTFADKIMGDGIAFEPEEGVIVSPIDGAVASVFPTKHAIGLISDTGVEILIHVGLDTVNMEGSGFNVFVDDGDKVKVGDKLMEFDLELIKKRATSHITPVVITNTDNFEYIKQVKTGKVSFKEEVLAIGLKQKES